MNAGLLQNWLNRVGPFVGLLLVIGIFSLLMDTPARFLSPNNLRIVLSQTVIVAIGAIGMTLIIISGGIDLAVGSTIALTGVVTALAINAGMPPSVALLSGILVGGLVGVVNGLVITRLKVVPFIATLGMLGVGRGVAKWLANQQTVNMPGTSFKRAVSDVSQSGVATRRARCLDHDYSRAVLGCDRFAQYSFWTACFCARLKRGCGTRVWYRYRSIEGLDLRTGRIAVRPRGRDADVAFAPGRSNS